MPTVSPQCRILSVLVDWPYLTQNPLQHRLSLWTPPVQQSRVLMAWLTSTTFPCPRFVSVHFHYNLSHYFLQMRGAIAKLIDSLPSVRCLLRSFATLITHVTFARLRTWGNTCSEKFKWASPSQSFAISTPIFSQRRGLSFGGESPIRIVDECIHNIALLTSRIICSCTAYIEEITSGNELIQNLGMIFSRIYIHIDWPSHL